MPPKSKKEQEEEALRLAEQQKRKEEEEARLALERQKYAPQTIATGLILPASNQLILDLYTQALPFVIAKLEEALKQSYPTLADQPRLKDLVINEVLNYLTEGSRLFGVGRKEVAGNQQHYLKARVLAGLALKVITHQHPSLGGSGKDKGADEALLKELLLKHVQEGEGSQKIYNAAQIEKVLNSINNGYFRHYLILWNHRNFQKRRSQTEQRIYIASPSTFLNSKNTAFTDLSEKAASKEEEKKQG